MDLLQFFAEVIKAGAWPSALVVVALMFRDDIKKLLEKLKSLEGPAGTKAAFEQEVKAVAVDTTELDLSLSKAPLQSDALKPRVARKPIVKTPPMPQARLRMTSTQFADERPAALVLDSWRSIEERLKDLSVAADLHCTRGPRELLHLLLSQGIVPAETAGVVENLLHLRNKVAHVEFEPNRDSAMSYYNSAARVVQVLDAIHHEILEHPQIGASIESP